MKYWAYLNDEVSQKAYSEEELQQIPGFGPDILICSEVSAVSQEPDWRPVKDLLPHLIKPKAPDFSKFRPKPPVPQQNNSNVLPVPQNLPSGVNATPAVNQSQVQNNSAAGLDANLLAQLQSLTSKIESLQSQIDAKDKEKELADINADEISVHEPGETFVSEPQNDQEDDVLEVPFDSDFEVPFDVNKTSEEIANEAEAMLSKRNATEIEEYNTDDQSTELMDYNSDMQKILEDTIRESNFSPEEPKKEEKKEKKRAFIAEDLISKTTLNLSEKAESKKDQQEKQESKPENKEEVKETVSEKQKEEEKETEVNIPAENEEELVQEDKPQEQDKEVEVTEEDFEEKAQDETQENISEASADETVQEQVQDDENHQPSVEKETEQVPEENQEEEQEKPQLVSVEEAPEAISEDATQEEEKEETVTPQLVSVEEAPEDISGDNTAKEEEQSATPQLVSVEEAPENISKDKVQDEEQKEESLPASEEENNETEPETEPEAENNEVAAEETESLVIAEEKREESDQTEPEESKEEVSQEEDKEEALVIAEESPEEENNTPEEKNEIDALRDEQQTFDEVAKAVEVPSDMESTNIEEQTANLSKMQEVTISEDDTTAAVLNEIAEEKAQNVTNMTTSEKLFAELESTYRNEENKDNNPENSQSKDLNEENDLEGDVSKEDEFLKTFTTSVEEVFLDQPTAIISDYVPPTDDTEHARPAVFENGIKREKPADIKTVPLVPGALGEEIHSSPYVESATARLRKTSVLGNFVKWMFVVVIIVAVVVMALSGLAVMGIIPEKLSPIHTVIYSLQKPPQNDGNVSAEDSFSPEMVDQVQNQDFEQNNNQQQVYDVISKVKNYTFSDGTTLGERIQNTHSNLGNEIEWSLFPTEENGIYSIAVKIPQNKDGQGFSYRFNYSLSDNLLTPTTSEAKNIIENYTK